MAGTTPISSIAYTELTDSPNIETATENLALSLEHLVIPKYSSTTDRDTKNPTPSEGDLCFVTNTRVLLLYTASAWRNYDQRQMVRQNADQLVNTSTYTDTALKFDVITGLSYMIRVFFEYTGDITAGVNGRWLPSTGSQYPVWCPGGLNGSGTATNGDIEMSAKFSGVYGFSGHGTAQANNMVAYIQGTLIAATFTGQMKWQIAQNTTTSGSTKAAVCKASSVLVAERIDQYI